VSNDLILTKINAALMIVLVVSGPALLAAVLIGFGVGLLQALTQIQDQSLPQAIKLIVVLLLLLLLIGPLLSLQIYDQARALFEDFPALTR